MRITTFTEAAETVDLDTLVASASMLTRVDRKYLLDAASLDRVLDILAACELGAAVLDIDGKRTFSYRSTYFDTPDLDAFTTAGRGRRRRFKVRTREYLDTGTTWLEVKTRGPRATTVKTRVEHAGDAGSLDRTARAEVARMLHAGGVDGVDVSALAPVLTTTYRRTTCYIAAGDNIPAARATIDTDLAWSHPGTGDVLHRDDLALIETKGARTASHLDRTLWEHGHRPGRISKYGTGMALMDHELPHLKWHRTLTALRSDQRVSLPPALCAA